MLIFYEWKSRIIWPSYFNETYIQCVGNKMPIRKAAKLYNIPQTTLTPPSTTPDIDATNCATETSPKKDVQEALILTTPDAVRGGFNM